MIEDFLKTFGEYIDFVKDAPPMMQIALGLAALTTILSLNKLWAFIKPVRLAVAYPLRGLAWVIHPRKKRNKNKEFKDAYAGPPDVVPFDITTSREVFLKTLKHYAGNEEKCALLTDDQISMLLQAGAYDCWNISVNLEKPLNVTRNKRYAAKEAQRVLARFTPKEPATVPANDVYVAKPGDFRVEPAPPPPPPVSNFGIGTSAPQPSYYAPNA